MLRGRRGYRVVRNHGAGVARSFQAEGLRQFSRELDRHEWPSPDSESFGYVGIATERPRPGGSAPKPDRYRGAI